VTVAVTVTVEGIVDVAKESSISVQTETGTETGAETVNFNWQLLTA
jgi:hypothetical protein